VGRTFSSVVWTGDELIAWGGEAGSEAEPRADGAAYDPATHAWRAVAEAPITARSEHVAVWTGDEMIVWGGYGPTAGVVDTGAYNPTTNEWRVLPRSPIRPAAFSVAIWTGKEAIFWGGVRAGGTEKAEGGAAYDPRRDRWRKISRGPLSMRSGAAGVWTGCEFVVWGGRENHGYYRDDGASYDPRTNRWHRLPRGPFPTEYMNGEIVTLPGSGPIPMRVFVHPNAVWTGSEMIVWGNLKTNVLGADQVAPAAAYDPARHRWRALSPAPIDFATESEGSGGDRAVWTGEEMIAWTGNVDRRGPRALLYDPSVDSWTPLAAPPPGSDIYFLDLVFTGEEVIAWGPVPPVSLRLR
jgi:hypothetical protein